jgi:hypothetical protein
LTPPSVNVQHSPQTARPHDAHGPTASRGQYVHRSGPSSST